MSTTIRVELGERSYPVVIGHGVTSDLRSLIPSTARRAVVITQSNIPVAIDPGVPHTTIVIGDGEAHKTLATIEDISRQCAAFGLTRDDVVIGVGGGIVTDVAGFAAASWHRGTAVVHVSTTLLGMVDAAIGGKTAVNIPEGKNLVGAFWQPAAVVCDLDALATLPDFEMRCGLGEVAKYQFISGIDFTALTLEERVAECVRIKADIVSQDEREGGQRALLNYGHPLAHAMETVGLHTMAHGEAVAIGLVFAATLGHALGRIDSSRLEHHEQVVGDVYGLATRPNQPFDVDALMSAMARDKKATSGLTFVLDSERGLEVVKDVDPSIVRSTLVDFLS